MYWNNKTGGHNTIGVTDTATTWYLAEGSTQTLPTNYEEWITIQNPNTTAATVNVMFMKPNGVTVNHLITVSATSRATVNANAIVPGADISTKVTSDIGVVVERTMYWNNKTGGHNTVAVDGN